MRARLSNQRGLFLVLEGIDGSGTTTQGQRLAAELTARGIDAQFTHEPSTGPVGRLLRRSLQGVGDSPVDWVTLALLFAADRADHLAREIEPALSAGSVVVCDRYDLSSFVYQSATAGDDDNVLAWLRSINSRARRPDLTLVVDVLPEVALRRRGQRGEAAELFEKKALQRKLSKLYRSAERFLPDDRMLHLDGNLGIEEVQQLVVQATLSALKEHGGASTPP